MLSNKKTSLKDSFLNILEEIKTTHNISQDLKTDSDFTLDINGFSGHSHTFDLVVVFKGFEIYIEFNPNVSESEDIYLNSIDWRYSDENFCTKRIFIIYNGKNLLVLLNKTIISSNIFTNYESLIEKTFGNFCVFNNSQESLSVIFDHIKNYSPYKLFLESFDVACFNDLLHRKLKKSGYFSDFKYDDDETKIDKYNRIKTVVRDNQPSNGLEKFDKVEQIINDETNKQKKLQDIQDIIEEYLRSSIEKLAENDESNEDVDFEFQLFNKLLPNLPPKTKFYRYGGLSLVHYLANEKTISFSGLTGMNDVSEVDYVESYSKILSSPHCFDNSKLLEDLNSKFIMCASKLEDNLNQWRLYGDDSKGVCLEMESHDHNSTDFYIKAVSYGEKVKHELNGNTDFINRHFELDILEAFQKVLFDKYLFTYPFKSLETWKHFFKSYEYAIEQEIRVLYINRKANDTLEDWLKLKWILTNSHNILNPLMAIKYNKLPFEITKVLFGSKAPEADVNIRQFKYLSKVNDMSLTFDKSRINNYR